nr:MAG TPA: hypothetical protein [Caudoviricetes sp.]DAO83829.1 MAG TPA: hypothetical protein [Caudoviricetes sp.]
MSVKSLYTIIRPKGKYLRPSPICLKKRRTYYDK